MDNQKNLKTSFWDFKTPKVYTSHGEQIADLWVTLLIFGLILNYLFIRVFSFQYKYLSEAFMQESYPVSYPVNEFLLALAPCFIIIIVMILGVVYFWKIRRYIAYGLLLLSVQGILMLTILLKSSMTYLSS